MVFSSFTILQRLSVLSHTALMSSKLALPTTSLTFGEARELRQSSRVLSLQTSRTVMILWLCPSLSVRASSSSPSSETAWGSGWPGHLEAGLGTGHRRLGGEVRSDLLTTLCCLGLESM